MWFDNQSIKEDHAENVTVGTTLSKPKVFLMGLDNSVGANLHEKGVNVRQGSLGKVYRVNLGPGAEQLRDSSSAVGYSEQEIVFLDLSYSVLPFATGEITNPESESGLWVKHSSGFVDTRVTGALKVRSGFDRIIDNGGVMVVFASPKTKMNIFRAFYSNGRFYSVEDQTADEWSFLSQLIVMGVFETQGEEISICNERTPIGRALSESLAGMKYECTLNPLYSADNEWEVLAKNKYDEAVALQKILPSGGGIFLLPHMQDKGEFIEKLLGNVFPEMFPRLFPSIDKGRWTNLPEYELDTVLKLKNEYDDLVSRYTDQLKKIEEDIASSRQRDGWIHDLLTQTGDPLVEAVVRALNELGFVNVIDMDKIRDGAGKTRREDLQIQDASSTLVVDIKGISNFPSDEDTMQAFKHATLVMREKGKVDVFALSIINHQRHLPPLLRDNVMPFRRELLHFATEHQQGLMTSWDLYRLVVNKRKNNWDENNIKPVLYRHGRIEPIPEHYTKVGCIAHVWSHAFGVDIEGAEISLGDTVAIESDIFFEEIVVDSLKVNGDNKTEAILGDKTGISWPSDFMRLKVGMQVYVSKKNIN